jgi:hypothetical protein
MAEDLKFEAIFLVKIKFQAATERDVLAIAEDIALLEGTKLISLSEWSNSIN